MDISDLLKQKMKTIPDWPKPGVLFHDITSVLGDAEAYRAVVDDFADRYWGNVDVIVGIDARGFIMGGAIAYALGLPFVPVRKKGKLPGETIRQTYDLEYGTDTLEMQKGALAPGQRAVVIDDLLATGGTAGAAASLVERLGGTVAELAFVVNLKGLGGRKRLEDAGRRVYAQATYE